LDNGWLGEDAGDVLPLLLMKSYFLVLLMLLVLALVSVIVLQPVFIVIKVADAVHWRWASVLAPVWIFVSGFFVYSSLIMYFSAKSRLKSGLAFAKSCLFVIFFAFLCARLDGATHWNWAEVFIPLFIHEGVNILLRLPKLTRSSYISEAQSNAEGTHRTYLGCGYIGFIVRQLFWPVLRAWFLAFLVAKISTDPFSWFVVAIPVFIGLVLGIIFKIVDDSKTIKAMDASAVGEEEQASAKSNMVCTTVIAVIFAAVLITFVGLLCGFLDGSHIKIQLVFIPVFIVMGLLLCCCCCCAPVLCCCFMKPGGLTEEEQAPIRTIAELYGTKHNERRPLLKYP